MGLDMYLNRKVVGYVRYSEENSVQAEIRYTDKTSGELIESVQVYNNTAFSIGRKSWRKANAIHNWFVQNVQDGEDDCGVYEVSEKDLDELKSLCENILHLKEKGDMTKAVEIAKDVLPTHPGFFFGDTEYDEWYFDSLEDTVSYIDELKALPVPETDMDSKVNFYDFYDYSSSW